MKSLDVDTKCRTEGRSFPRRKVTSKSLVLNGAHTDFDMELSLAIQESLKYAAQEKENVMKNKTLSNSNGYHSEDSGSASNFDTEQSNKDKDRENGTNSDSGDSEEVCRLKDLLMTQAELIQCQQEEILQKDKEIRELVAAKDALQCRLERMERRMSILRQKEEDDSSGKIADVSNIKKITDEIIVQQKGVPGTSNGDIIHKQKKRRCHHFVQRKRSKYRRIDYLQSSEAKDSGDDGSGFSQSEGEGHPDLHTDDEDKENQPEIHSDAEAVEEPPEKVIDYPILTTEHQYHVYYPRHVFASLEGETVHERLQQQLQVETPSWRIRTFSSQYQLEGTENITDEAYLKRHQKYEFEEKRRKRWDLQRIRELKVYERHQRQKEEEMRASEEEEDVETFLPSVQHVKEIEITESLPVMAFGQPVPYISPGEFEIPWEFTPSPHASQGGRLKAAGAHSRRH